MTDAAFPSVRLRRLGITRVRDNRGPGQTVTLDGRAVARVFGDELRARLARGAPVAARPRRDATPAPRQADLPGFEHPRLHAAYIAAGLDRVLPFAQALAEPATRQCLELMAQRETG